VSNFCFSKDECFAPDTTTGTPQWLFVPYAESILNILKIDLGVNGPTPANTLPFCTGRDTTTLSGYCWRGFDGATTRLEKDKVANDITNNVLQPPAASPYPQPNVAPAYRGFTRFSDAALAEGANADAEVEAETDADADAQVDASEESVDGPQDPDPTALPAGVAVDVSKGAASNEGASGGLVEALDALATATAQPQPKTSGGSAGAAGTAKGATG